MSFNLQRLKAERMAEGYTQEDFAKKLGMSRGAYAKREAGIVDISVEDLSHIMDALGYDASKVSIFLLLPFAKKNGSDIKNSKTGE